MKKVSSVVVVFIVAFMFHFVLIGGLMFLLVRHFSSPAPMEIMLLLWPIFAISAGILAAITVIGYPVVIKGRTGTMKYLLFWPLGVGSGVLIIVATNSYKLEELWPAILVLALCPIILVAALKGLLNFVGRIRRIQSPWMEDTRHKLGGRYKKYKEIFK